MTRPITEKVVAAYLHPIEVSAAFMESFVHMLVYDAANDRRILEGGGFLALQAGSNLSGPRNKVVEQFLGYGQADWLVMIDSDMVFSPDLVDRLLEHADPDKAPIVGALCFVFDEDGKVKPTLYGLMEDDEQPDPQVIRYETWPPDTMMQVAATGTGCVLIHKSALQRIAERKFNSAFPWFQETSINGKPCGEDITFCFRAIQCDIPVHVNTAVKIGHVKRRILTVESWMYEQGLIGSTHQGVAL